MLVKTTKVIRWNVRCIENEHRAVTYVLAGDTYGRLLGRTAKNELAEFDSWEASNIYKEIEELMRHLLGQERGTSDCFRRILGAICDQAPSGDLYDFTGKILCPICCSPNVDYGPDDPPVLETITLPQIEFSRWGQLTSMALKSAFLEEALSRAGCLPWAEYVNNLRFPEPKDKR